MMQFLVFIIVLATIVGVVWFGWAKIVLACVLVALALTFVAFLVSVVLYEAKQPPAKPASPDTNNPSADEFRAMKVAEAGAVASPDPAAEATPDKPDNELLELRKMAGLE